MKIYLLSEIASDHDGEHFPSEAFASREKAEAARLRLEKKRQNDDLDRHQVPMTEYYRVVELDVSEDEVTYESVQARIGSLEQQASDLAAAQFESGARALFDEFPDLQSFGWEQYTPAWNDGDPCHFRVYCEEPYIDGQPSWNMDATDLDRKVERVCQLISSIRNDDLEKLFGDGFLVTVSRPFEVSKEYHRA